MSEQPSAPDVKKHSPKNNVLFAGIILLIIVIVAAFVILRSDNKVETTTVAQPLKTPTIMALKPNSDDALDAPANSIETPQSSQTPQTFQAQTLPVSGSEEPSAQLALLPTLDDSDPVVIAKLDEYLSNAAMRLIVNDDVIRRSVVFIDNLAKGKVATKHTPVAKLEEGFSVNGSDIITISPNSYERYTPYVKILTSLSAAQAVRLYEEYKPLINSAYTEIGYNDDEFTQTLENAIDLLLDTPDPKGSLPLLRDSVTYQYAFSEWEQLPAAQKQLLRMGPENIKQVKSALSNIKKQFQRN